MERYTHLFKMCCLVTGFFLLVSCNSGSGGNRNSAADSVQIRTLLQSVYKWHNANWDRVPDFMVLVKDTLQVGIDTGELMFAVNELKKTKFFTGEFLKNYEQIGRETDNKLRTAKVKYLNEINFSFQDADPWTYFQDDAGKYWDSLKIRHLAINADTASLRWSVNLIEDTLGYLVKLKRDNTGWKVAYMEGFDMGHVFMN